MHLSINQPENTNSKKSQWKESLYLPYLWDPRNCAHITTIDDDNFNFKLFWPAKANIAKESYELQALKSTNIWTHIL